MAKIIEDNTNIVILGTWNLGILIPEWFKEQFPEIVKENEIPIEVAIGASSFRFIINDILINPSPNKLILTPKKQDVEHYRLTFEIARGVVERLHHTPIYAVGNNISFLLENKTFKLFNDPAIQEQEDFYTEVLQSGKLDSWQLKNSLSFDDYILNITYDFTKKRKVINFNYHYPITNKGKIKDYLAEFLNNINKSKEILDKIVE